MHRNSSQAPDNHSVNGPDLSSIVVILHTPRYPENIGAAARCCKNMGIGTLRLVRPERLEMDRILKMATHEASDIVEQMSVHDNLMEAAQDLHFLVGTTARTGRKRRPTHSPRQIASKIATFGPEIKTGVLFGSEKWGLSNDVLDRCSSLVVIPTSKFSSINLAQSVMILCYEILMAKLEGQVIHRPRPADFMETEGMYRHLHSTFEQIGLFQKQTPSYWMRNARRLFNGKNLTARDVKMVRGFLRQVNWALKNARK